MAKLIIVGHKNPDTDSIVSAIGAKEYFREIHGLEAEAFRSGEINNETKFILEKFGLTAPELIGKPAPDDKVALVDHNETTQTFDGLDFNQVEYVLDHHKLSIKTERPIFCRFEPIGSTSSLIAKLMFTFDKAPSRECAGLLVAGILSDTLNLTSPTTTPKDKEILEKLNEIAQIDIESFVSEMFAAKSSLEGITVEEIITLDYKKFEMGKHKVGGAAWETTDPESINEKKAEIMEALKKKKISDGLDYLLFMVIDIIKQNCQLYIIGESEKVLAEKVFKGKIADDIMELPGVVSRKKQIIPPLTEELSK